MMFVTVALLSRGSSPGNPPPLLREIEPVAVAGLRAAVVEVPGAEAPTVSRSAPADANKSIHDAVAWGLFREPLDGFLREIVAMLLARTTLASTVLVVCCSNLSFVFLLGNGVVCMVFDERRCGAV
mmetsp:Transcript_57098/g.116208  ORF Transcript_57098/g.116208 Transcript_57098/m.116208 type:complete len:126 (+) Transcript_57098:311-688(+)